MDESESNYDAHWRFLAVVTENYFGQFSADMTGDAAARVNVKIKYARN